MMQPSSDQPQQQQPGSIPAGDVLMLLMHKDMTILQLQARLQQLEAQLGHRNGQSEPSQLPAQVPSLER